MKVITFSFLILSGFIFAQKIPCEKIPGVRLDSLQFKKFSFEEFQKKMNNQSSLKNDSSVYKILNKKPENPELYSMLVKKPDLNSIISIPNLFQPRDLKIKLPENPKEKRKK